jgi:hypothetical protein
MLDAALFGVVGDWKRNDATATDNSDNLDEAIYAAGNREPEQYIDFGRHNGDVIQLPAGSIMLSRKVVLPWGVSLRGSSQAGTQLIMKETFNPADHFIDLGDSSVPNACFGSSLQDLGIWCPPEMPANYGPSVIFSNNAQDNDPVFGNLRIQAGKRHGIWYEHGHGGATKVTMRELSISATGPNSVPLVVKCSGSTIVEVSSFKPTCGWIDNAHPEEGARVNSIGMVALGGSFRITDFHPEGVETGIFFNMNGRMVDPPPPAAPAPDPNCMAECSFFTGGGGLKSFITIANNPNQKDKIWLRQIMRKGSWTGPTVTNGHPGTSHIYTDIKEQIRL